MPTTPIGLCATCAHQRLIRSGRGSTFSLCERGLTDPAWAKYPRLPVLRCGGYEPPGAATGGEAPGTCQQTSDPGH